MSSTSDFVKFEQYDDAEIMRFTHLRNSAAWKGQQTAEEYADREKVLGSSEVAQKHLSKEIQEKYPAGHEWLGLKYFVLKDTRLPLVGKTSQIVSSCETLNRLGYCTTPTSGGKIVPCLNVCIGGVFTPEEFRGRGYAKQMINALNEFYDKVRDTPGAPTFIKNIVITLYSEVGDYYSQMGYKTMHVPLHNITHLDELSEEYCGDTQAATGSAITWENYQHLIELEDTQFQKKLLESHKANPDAFVFMVKPDMDIFKWFQHRDVFIQHKTGNGTEPRDFGFVSDSDQSHVMWHHNWNDNKLVITKVYIPDSTPDKEAVLRVLISRSIAEAKSAKLATLQWWDSEIPLTQFPELQKVLHRVCDDKELYAQNGSISAARPPAGFDNETIVWEENSKFCWF